VIYLTFTLSTTKSVLGTTQLSLTESIVPVTNITLVETPNIDVHLFFLALVCQGSKMQRHEGSIEWELDGETIWQTTKKMLRDSRV